MSADKPHKDGTGVLYPTSERFRSENPDRPQHTGECTIGEKRFRIAAWEQSAGFLSLSFTEPQPKQEAAQPQCRPGCPACNQPAAAKGGGK